MIDVEPLLAPTQAMPPCGVDLEYDAQFVEFEALANGKPERQFDTQAEEPPWHEVMERAAVLLGRSKDLRVALAYTRAAAHATGIVGFYAGLRLLLGLLERYWEGLYPALDADDNSDPGLRINALAPLADPYTPFDEGLTLLHDLRESEVCRIHGERLTVRDILIAQGRLAAPEGTRGVTLQRVEGLLGAAAAQDPAVLADGLALPKAVEELANRMTERFGAERAPTLTTMMSTAQHVAAVFRSVAVQSGAAGDSEAQDEVRPDDSPALAVADHRPASRAPGEIQTRQDAIALLDAVCAFLERTEPTNPAPLLIRRARALMGKDFIAVMQDLAPDSLAQIHLITGTRPE